MIRTIRDLRTTDTKDLSASLRSDRRSCVVRRVLNLAEGGMLINTDSDLQVGDSARVELSGPDFHYAGVVEVVHRDDRVMGLRFVSWQGPTARCVRALVAARLCGQQLESHHPDPWAVGRASAWSSRTHDRAALSRLSAVIDESPEGTTSCHEVLNVSERGMLIDDLTLPAGSRLTFLLAGRGMNHVGRGRVAHQTGTIAGVAIDHWYGAPEAIRALINGEAAFHLPRADAYVTEWC